MVLLWINRLTVELSTYVNSAWPSLSRSVHSAVVYTRCPLATISANVWAVAGWMQSNWLLNPGKTELLWCMTSRRQNRLLTATLTVGSSTVSPVSSVRDLGILVDSWLCDAHSRLSDGVALLCSTVSVAQHSPPYLGNRLSVACYCFSSQLAGLR